MDSPTQPVQGAATLLGDLRAIFRDRLTSVVAYGPQVEGHPDAPLTCLALVDSLTVADLDACARKASHWKHERIAVPLILPSREFLDSLDAFPLEYGEILRAHRPLHGDDPFAHVSITHADLRRACETQVKSHLVHLRQGFITTGGNPTAIANLVRGSAPAFAALLRNVARLCGADTRDRLDAAHAGARAAGLTSTAVNDVLALEQPATIPVTDPARLFPEYLAVVEQLSHTVDTWPA